MGTLFSLIRLIRPKHWIKNAFVFAPLFFSPWVVDATTILHVFVGAVIFCFTASSIYILNDIKDCGADKLHPQKCKRPLASGQLNLKFPKILFVMLSVVSLLSALFFQWRFFIVIFIYYTLNIAYSYRLKEIALIDIYCIAAGFILRVVAGAVLIDVMPSAWILTCTGLLALFLALAKRRDDLIQGLKKSHRSSIQGYNISFIDTSIGVVLSALFISYTIYTTQTLTAEHLGTTRFFYTVPFVLIGILRYLQITLVKKRSGDPTNLLFHDKFLLFIVIAWVGVSTYLVYFT